MSADALSTSSRAFYEQTRFKMAASIFLASMGMMSLAYVSTYGGESNSANFMAKVYKRDYNDDSREQSEIAKAGGYGDHICIEECEQLVVDQNHLSNSFRLRSVHVLRGVLCVPVGVYLYFSHLLRIRQ